MKRRDLALLLLFPALCLGGCDKGQPDDRSGESGAVTYGHPATNMNWLRTGDRTDPALWLAGKEAHDSAPPSPEAIARIQNALANANDRFLETPRMIANRTAQLSDMLALDGKEESYIDLIESLTKIVEGSKGKQEYGDLCQHYYNLRHHGTDKAAALAALTEKNRALIRNHN